MGLGPGLGPGEGASFGVTAADERSRPGRPKAVSPSSVYRASLPQINVRDQVGLCEVHKRAPRWAGRLFRGIDGDETTRKRNRTQKRTPLPTPANVPGETRRNETKRSEPKPQRARACARARARACACARARVRACARARVHACACARACARAHVGGEKTAVPGEK